MTTTDEVKVNDIIFYRHGELCKDLRNSYDQEHDIVEQSEGSILYKYRWALVIAKYNRNLLVIPMTTFSNTPKSSKQKQTIFNEVTGTRESALKDYIHVVADSHPGTSEDWPGCWGNDQRVHYRSFDRDPGLKKDSFANLMMGHWVLEGTPLLIKGTIVKTASREALTMARKEAHRREEIAMDMAVEDQTGRVATREQQRELTRARIARQDQSIARHTEGQKSRLTEDIYDDPLPPPPKRTKYGDREDALDRARPCDPSQPEPTLTTQLGHTAEPRPVGNAPATAFNGLNMNTATGSRPGSS